MSQIWFTSDLHFFHENVIRYCNRPYRTVHEMNEALISNWNKVVKPEDTVYCLGDMSLAWRPIELFSTRLNGQKFLVPGNHDFCHTYHKKSRQPENHKKWVREYEKHGWTVLPEQYVLSIDDMSFNLCHHPYKEELPDKYEKWRLDKQDKWLLCGHVHEKYLKQGRNINVGTDVWDYKPVNIEDIKKVIEDERAFIKNRSDLFSR